MIRYGCTDSNRESRGTMHNRTYVVRMYSIAPPGPVLITVQLYTLDIVNRTCCMYATAHSTVRYMLVATTYQRLKI